MQSYHIPMQGPYDYVSVAHAWLLTIKFLQCSHCCLYNSAIIFTAMPKCRFITSINCLTSHACIHKGFLCVFNKVVTYVSHSTSAAVCFSASFTLRILVTMKEYYTRTQKIQPLSMDCSLFPESAKKTWRSLMNFTFFWASLTTELAQCGKP